MTFTVNPVGSSPTLTSISPNSGVQGQGVAVTLTGTNFVAGATIGVSGAGITVSNTTVASATQITATFTIAANAATGAQNVTVTTSGGTSGAQPFTVNLAPPTLTSISPNSGVQGQGVAVTLTGTNFIAGATIGREWRRDHGQQHDGGERHADHGDVCHRRQCRDRRSERHRDDLRRDQRCPGVYSEPGSANTDLDQSE